ncbi:MAG: outer membrane beta-barrel protein [Ferruginibacter sp.]
MKKLIIATAIILLASVKTFAQSEEGEFKPFKVDVSLGYAIPTSGGAGAKGGVLFVVEPKYAVIPQLSVGLRLETAVMVSGIDASGNVSNTASAKASASYLATGDYYFNNNDFRPFAGAGVGIFKTAGVSVNSNNPNIATGSKFGGMIRAGFEYKHARVGLEYNLVGKSTVPPSSSTSNDGYTIKNGYLGIKIGVCIGGGRI